MREHTHAMLNSKAKYERDTGSGYSVLTNHSQLIIYEHPLFVVPTQSAYVPVHLFSYLHSEFFIVSVSPEDLISSNLQRLDTSAREAFFNLSYVNLPNGVDPQVDTGEVALAIFQTNAVAAGNGGVGIFPRMARLNHGCSGAFNVVYTWRENEGAIVVHAL
jgi:hypothetical protein